MPEYLAPGVYVEEVEAGVKSIEGVSTSTAGMVGLTERGPVSIPILVTGFAQYRRIFGGFLSRRDFPDLWFLPHAVEGFFLNGGKRLFLTRVVADQAPNLPRKASTLLFGRDAAVAAVSARLAVTARPGYSILVVDNRTGFTNGSRLRVDDGPDGEYLRLQAANAIVSGFGGGQTRVRGIRTPLSRDRDAATPVVEVTLAPPPQNPIRSRLAAAIKSGATEVTLADRTGIAAGDNIRVGSDVAADREYVRVASVPTDPSDRRIMLQVPLARAHPTVDANNVAIEVWVMAAEVAGGATQLSQPASARDGLIVVDNAGVFTNNVDLIRIGTGTGAEFHRLVVPQAVGLGRVAERAHPPGEPVRVVTDARDQANNLVYSTTLTAVAPTGTRALTLQAAPPAAITQGALLRIGTGARVEYRRVQSTAAQAPQVTLQRDLGSEHQAGDAVVLVSRGNPAAVVQALEAGDRLLVAADAPALSAGDTVEVGESNSEEVEYHVLEPATPGALILNVDPNAAPTPGTPINRTHPQGSLLQRRNGLLTVEALDVGAWGNDLRVTADRDGPILDTTVAATPAAVGAPIPLGSAVGVEQGTVLEIGYRPGALDTPETPGTLVKVTRVAGNAVEVTPAFAAAKDMQVRTREFKLTVDWVKQGEIIQSETFSQLSLDSRHSRYAPLILGDVAARPRLWDNRPEGESELVRLRDEDFPNATTTIRLWPDLLTEMAPTGLERPLGRFLDGGSEALDGVDKSRSFIGRDSVEPVNRTGLHTLKNERAISIISVPGRTEADVQQMVINQCTELRYRFAVLDSPRGPARGASLADVQRHRQQYDTKYAALYYPWLTIPDPTPPNPALASEVPIPPSGHMIGIYANTDVLRGVHKAPANEVIRGVTGIQRKVTKEEQDLLNPSPLNVNVLRDFREEGRGMRVWGARVSTSDTAWKYINVRRLFIFIEASLDVGLQWVVFEPNDYKLWARVRQSITDFLTRVWRDGALLGRTPEEAFFVKCDETTMTPDDLNLGKLIVEIGIAPVKPAEYVIIRIAQWAGGSSVQEL